MNIINEINIGLDDALINEPYKPLKYLYDRTDVYELLGRQEAFQSYSIIYIYTLKEVCPNPDFDW